MRLKGTTKGLLTDRYKRLLYSLKYIREHQSALTKKDGKIRRHCNTAPTSKERPTGTIQKEVD